MVSAHVKHILHDINVQLVWQSWNKRPVSPMSERRSNQGKGTGRSAAASSSIVDFVVSARKGLTGTIASYPLVVFLCGIVLMLGFIAISFGGILDTGDSSANSPGQILALSEPAVANA